jgi:hypothetical protein
VKVNLSAKAGSIAEKQTVPPVNLKHVKNLTTSLGLFEHADGPTPRTEHGYCVDDNARALVLIHRMSNPPSDALNLANIYLDFTLSSLGEAGACHNRMNNLGTWVDEPFTGDHWGRLLWGLGATASQAQDPATRHRAKQGALLALKATSPHPRALAYATLGAYQLLHSPEPLLDYERELVLEFLTKALVVLDPTPPRSNQWPWPWQTLTYANALIPHALLLIGASLANAYVITRALSLLTWLVEEQLVKNHLSLVPVAGKVPGAQLGGFDQQPIEASTLAEAAAVAFDITGDKGWLGVIELCVYWFLGFNDNRHAVWDESTQASFDGLTRSGVNLNQGAESTLAALSTFQLSHAFEKVSLTEE